LISLMPKGGKGRKSAFPLKGGKKVHGAAADDKTAMGSEGKERE